MVMLFCIISQTILTIALTHLISLAADTRLMAIKRNLYLFSIIGGSKSETCKTVCASFVDAALVFLEHHRLHEESKKMCLFLLKISSVFFVGFKMFDFVLGLLQRSQNNF